MSVTAPTTLPDLAGLLRARGVIDAESLARIETLRAGAPQRLAKLLVDTGLLSWDQILGLVADATSLQTAILVIPIVTWGLCFLFYLGALFTIDKDHADLRAQMAERAKSM